MYARGFLLLEKDIGELFEFIEPSDQNCCCYSFRIHELLLRACVEVEANCTAILKENSYEKSRSLNMRDYKKINASHHLSSFDVQLPRWQGRKKIRKPFEMWGSGRSLPWWQAYNETKHDRRMGFAKATFDHLIDAACGVVTILYAQFSTVQYDNLLTVNDLSPEFHMAIGRYFAVRFPNDWPEEQRYTFSTSEWHEYVSNEENPFQDFPYPST
jgi:hypothetical protein